MIVFRGTEPLSIKNWLADIDFLFTYYPGCVGCRVHRGFYKGYLSIQQGILESAKKLFTKYPNSRKLVTGHSYGGALAFHASVDIIKNFGPIDEFYTYGSPGVGNQEFANYINYLIPGSFNSRIVHSRDPVPHLPFQAWGFYHIDREVFYNIDNSGYNICIEGEDPSCSNSK